MEARSIAAYDLPARVASYDADMEVMHPNRAEMVRVALDALPFAPDAPLAALDLGIGTGYFTARFLERFPAARVVAIDGARAMLDLARARLGPRANALDLRVGDFRALEPVLAGCGPFDVVYSSYALHHLDAGDKEALVRTALARTRPGGWFVNADLIVAGSRRVEARIQELRVAGIVARGRGDERFPDAGTTRRFLDELEANEGDQPLTLAQDVAILARAGLADAAVLWLEHREAVCGGPL